MHQVPIRTLNNGVTMPALGFGVFQSSPEDTVTSVKAALETGYRHVDTAAAYHNEEQVGQAIRESPVDRDAVFIETKIWIDDYGTGLTYRAGEAAMRRLGVDVIDLLILHQPNSKVLTGTTDAADFARTIAAYKDLERLLADGKVRAIGVSNFQPNQLRALMESTDVTPTINQIELHPYFQEKSVVAADDAAGVLTQAWSPIGGITFYPGWDDRGHSTLQDPTLLDIGKAHGKTAAQVMLRWHIQEGRSAIPKSIHPVRIVENFGIFDFELTDEELTAIDGLDTGRRSGPDPSGKTTE
ncbi:aldo/keto reductase [Bifidobacterium bombi]|uniref:2,5-didehydrogluconate reductase n=1 Tax=Bifidobacterium bombi DSM 19703 TaxID=1341695 RepID=A0A080N2R2_9BIFI|nr:aldo/keto reductase [Bifidobacterium bombi]KFF31166.1 2,5-didehydrogluconate reductase [Bifidobacterium bombi DSM 19703]